MFRHHALRVDSNKRVRDSSSRRIVLEDRFVCCLVFHYKKNEAFSRLTLTNNNYQPTAFSNKKREVGSMKDL